MILISNKDQQTILREDLYNRLSRILTEAEEYWQTNNDEMLGCEEELYQMLVRIQNNWEDITTDNSLLGKQIQYYKEQLKEDRKQGKATI